MFPSGHIPPDNSPQTMIAHTLLYGVTDKLMRQVQSVQNAAARLITEPNIANTSHRYCVNFIGCRSDNELNLKMASLVYQVLSSKVSGYLADDIHLASENSTRSLRSSSE